MKFYPIKIIGIIICLFLITGCAKNPPSLEERVAGRATTTVATIKSYTGTIESFGVDIYKDGTHKLKTSDSKIIVIQSSIINLNNYINKKVTIEGSMQKLLDNKSEVFTVNKIKFEGSANSDGTTDYKSQQFGFELKYPNAWELSEDSQSLTFSGNSVDLVKLDIFSSVSLDLDKFAKSKEFKDGTAVTIASQRSLRYTDSGTIKIYIPNTSLQKVYKITFYVPVSVTDKNSNEKLFYTFLESFKLITGDAKKGQKCGGKDAISCPANYICELESGSQDADGVCTSVDKKVSPDCPYVSIPLGCSNYKAKSVNKEGCPTSYECLDTSSATTSGSTQSITKNSVDQVFIKYQKQILPSGAKLLQLEIVEKQNLLSAIYTVNNIKYKNLYEYSPSADEYNFTKKAYFKEINSAWSLQEGADVRITADKKIINF